MTRVLDSPALKVRLASCGSAPSAHRPRPTQRAARAAGRPRSAGPAVGAMARPRFGRRDGPSIRPRRRQVNRPVRVDSMTLTEALRQKREDIVREHMESENRHEFDVTMDTFHHPRYELIGTGDVFDGEAEVAAYFEETRTAFPDQRNELIALHHCRRRGIRRGDALRHPRGTVARPAAHRPQLRDAVPAPSSSSRRTGSSASASTSTAARSCASSASPATPTASAAG